jgi:hypothetical protein
MKLIKLIIEKNTMNRKFQIISREFVDADTLNPEILERRFNMRHTKISEYSNAVYNGSVSNIILIGFYQS